MDADQIARWIVKDIHVDCGDDGNVRIDDESEVIHAIATAIRSAHRAGYEAAREQAAGVADKQRKTWRHSPDAEAACWALEKAIRAMEPST